MDNEEIAQLELHADEVRRRLATNLRELCSDGALSQTQEHLRARAMAKKDALIDQAKAAAQERTEGILDSIKARVAANPAAAAAIGAGIAWRLYREPPIATVLVGAGLLSLMRTDGSQPSAASRLRTQAGRFNEAVEARVEELKAIDAAGKARSIVSTVRSEIGEMAETAREQIVALSETTRERAAEIGVGAVETARRRSRSLAAKAQHVARTRGGPLLDHVPDYARDQYLLGAAALAIVAAIGVAGARRQGAAEKATRRRVAQPGRRRPALPAQPRQPPDAEVEARAGEDDPGRQGQG